MAVIVTGATSFIGRAAVKELLIKGEDVLAVSRPASAGAGALQELFRDLKQQAEEKGEKRIRKESAIPITRTKLLRQKRLHS